MTSAQDRVWTQTGESFPEFAQIDEAIRLYMQTWDIPGGAFAATYRGRLVFARGYTWDLPEVEPIEPTSLFRIASMSKPITSVAIHQLIERGLLSYDTLVAETLNLEPPPGQAPDPWLAEVTVNDLLYHIGGWDRDLTFDPMFYDFAISNALGVERPISKSDIATYMTGQEMQHRPGTRYAYSNYGYMLLGMLIEEVTGCDYSEWVAENVFQPIGVGRPRRGHTRLDEAVPKEVHYYATGANPYFWNIENMDSHGGWILSAPDYLCLMSSLFDDPFNSPLLSRDSIENMMRTNSATSQVYARGWTAFEEDGLLVYGHDGRLPGTITSGQWMSNGLGIVGLLNTSRTVGNFQLDFPNSVPDHDLFESVGISASGLGVALAESWVAIVASGSGAGDSIWRSDVGLLNRSALTNKVRMRIERPEVEVDHELELRPGEHLIVEDVVAALGLAGSGSLRVFSAEPLTVSSRTYNTSENGTFGQFLGGVTGPGGLGNGESVVLMHLREDASARSNIGVLNAGRRATSVRVQLFDGSGLSVADFDRRVAAREVVQLNRPFAEQGGRTDVRAGFAVITVREGEEVVVYGSVIDTVTNDPTTIPMKFGYGATETFVCAAARVAGAAGSEWRTDLGILNHGAETTNLTVVYHGGNGEDLTMEITLASGEHRVFEDVVGMVGGGGSGSLEIVADRPVLVSSRTYNQGANGTFGQYIDGVSEAGSAAAGQSLWLPQLQQNDGFRTNIGLHNSGLEQSAVMLRLYDHEAALVSASQHVIGAGKRMQLQTPFDSIGGRTDITSGYAVIEIQSGDGLFAYASVIDNRTNDPTTVFMVR